MTHHFLFIGFILGVVFVCQSPLQAPIVGLAILLALLIILWRKPAIRKVIAGLILGCVATLLHLSASAWLPHSIELGLSRAIADVEIVSVEAQRGVTTEFIGLIHTLDGVPVPRIPPKVRMAWKHAPSITAGQRWRMPLKLKPVVGLSNPGLPDKANIFRARGIQVTGVVLTEPQPKLIVDRKPSKLSQMREKLRQGIGLHADKTSEPLLLALAVGDKSHMSAAHWKQLRKTSTAHLMAISGMHVGMVFAIFYIIFYPLANYLCSYWHTATRKMLASSCAVSCSLFYATLTGGAISTQRAWVMCIIALGVVALRRKVPLSGIVLLAVSVLLLYNPWASLSIGLWLSAGAVMILAWVGQHQLTSYAKIKAMVFVQPRISLALMPMTIVFLHHVAWISPIANLIAIPWVTLLIVPALLLFDLLYLVLPSLAVLCLEWAQFHLNLLWQFLAYASKVADITVIELYNPWQWVALGLCCCLLWLPKNFPGRIFLPLLCCVLLFPQLPQPGPGEAWIDVIDVGQGLGVWVRTQEHQLVFDAGHPVVADYLTRWGATHLDKVIISHADWDHRGGLRAVQQAVNVDELWSGGLLPNQEQLQQPCIAGTQWVWEGVQFEFLHPNDPGGWKGNNGSCVLRIRTEGGSLLLSGDIEKKAEKALLAHNPAALRADILIAPHHGSKTSSSQNFLAAVSPQRVIFSSGYLNRYHHPHAEVVDRYHKMGVKTYNTAQYGALRVTLSNDGITLRCTKNEQLGWKIFKGETC